MDTDELLERLAETFHKSSCDSCKNNSTCLDYALKIYHPEDCEFKDLTGRSKYFYDNVGAADMYHVWSEEELSGKTPGITMRTSYKP